MCSLSLSSDWPLFCLSSCTIYSVSLSIPIDLFVKLRMLRLYFSPFYSQMCYMTIPGPSPTLTRILVCLMLF